MNKAEMRNFVKTRNIFVNHSPFPTTADFREAIKFYCYRELNLLKQVLNEVQK